MLNLFSKFHYAARGIGEAAKGSSFRIQLFAAFAVAFAIFYFPLASVEKAVLVFATFFVLILEMLNTIIERYADFISKDADPRVKIIKDLSAGAVLLSAAAAAIVGLIVLLPVIIPVGRFYFLKFKERNIINAHTCIKAGYPVVKISNTISECKTFTGKKFNWIDYTSPKEETDEEIIENYKSGKFTVIGSEINPYNQESELIILTFFDYKKFNEPSPRGCGVHSVSCYILLKTNDNVSVIAKSYSASLPYWDKGLKADFITAKIINISLINFLDKENVILRSEDTLSGLVSFFKINLNTKEINRY